MEDQLGYQFFGSAIFAIIVMFVIWYYTGGPERAKVADPFLKPPAPIDSGETYGPRGN